MAKTRKSRRGTRRTRRTHRSRRVYRMRGRGLFNTMKSKASSFTSNVKGRFSTPISTPMTPPVSPTPMTPPVGPNTMSPPGNIPTMNSPRTMKNRFRNVGKGAYGAVKGVGKGALAVTKGVGKGAYAVTKGTLGFAKNVVTSPFYIASELAGVGPSQLF